MPQRFTKLGADLWRPVVLNRGDPALKGQFFMFQGKLKPGVTLEQAAADVDVIARRVAQQNPTLYPKQFTVRVVSWVDSIVGPFKTTLYTLAAAVALLLAISCFNVANMLLALATGREKEMAIRGALGAGRMHLVRQLLVESLLLATGGAAIGCLFAYAGTKGIAQLIPDGYIPREVVIRLNVPVLVFSLAAAVLTALVFGLAPAIQTARRNVVDSLKDSGKGVSGGFRRSWLRNGLVIAEVALSLTLLAGAGLLMRSFIVMQRVDLGLNPDNILVARLPLPRGQYQTRPRPNSSSSRSCSRGCTPCLASWPQPKHPRCRHMAGSTQRSRFQARRQRSGGTRSSSCAARGISRRSAFASRAAASCPKWK